MLKSFRKETGWSEDECKCSVIVAVTTKLVFSVSIGRTVCNWGKEHSPITGVSASVTFRLMKDNTRQVKHIYVRENTTALYVYTDFNLKENKGVILSSAPAKMSGWQEDFFFYCASTEYFISIN